MMTTDNEAQRREDILLELYKFHAYIPNDAIGNPLTPFGNFAEGYNAAKADSAREITELQSQINRLREALIDLMSYQNGCPLPSYEKGWDEAMQLSAETISETPAQSLKAHDDELIDKCVAAIINVGGKRVWEFADAIRYLKNYSRKPAILTKE